MDVGFDYPLLSDSDRKVAESLGVGKILRIVGPNHRTTFVIDTARSSPGSRVRPT